MNPILLDFPDSFQTRRLLVRAPKAGDGIAVCDAIRTSLPDLKPWMPFAREEPKEDEVKINIRRAQADFILRKDLRMHIFHRETGQFVGSTGLHRMNWEARRFEIGYWCSTAHAEQGYMTEAIQGLIDYARRHLGAKRLEICCDSLNLKSRKMAERLGFELEAVLRSDDLSNDRSEYRDTCLYAAVF
ncbi:GNAT family N-acetyltransferase [Bacillus glycinifermentans]|mgnify:CR=1 FL=1|uniref:GCN5 family acetyltransferase n=1 Tax=Bacillus glycinifermentans TaxID=1664069 RepID=A0A0T6BU40_9BACI|nr:GNAT family N-acetyltransferase [Bacillus glycinifermentans]ATH92254.1 N-acetyltransferase [Bacillus glycinifermentans]KRT95002.1 GCN5 family acetyltransferase [Bacillus glycinifermentans]MEC0484772.1 GNAT family N-acetyltransferase [Bacillus glycinifermentans]